MYKDSKVGRITGSASWSLQPSGRDERFLEMLQRIERILNASRRRGLDLRYYAQLAGLFKLMVADSRGIDLDYRREKGDLLNMELEDFADSTCGGVISICFHFYEQPCSMKTALLSRKIIRSPVVGRFRSTAIPKSAINW